MYLVPFTNQYRDHDFTLVADIVKQYYPITKPPRLTPESLASSTRFKKIGKIVNKEFLNQRAYDAKWGKLTSILKKVLNKPVRANPDMFGGGFVGEVIIKDDQMPDFIRQKSLKFYVSIIGPFFSIHGVDSSIALLDFDSAMLPFGKGHYPATHAITVSPVHEYREVFTRLEKELRSFFTGYRFVPYTIGMTTIKNISVSDDLRDPRTIDTIYEAIFGQRAVHDCPTRGNQSYGMSDWVKPLTAREKSMVDLVAQHARNAPNETTIHKVWKLQESKRLESFKVRVHLMFVADLFGVIDFTDKSKFIMVSQERGAPTHGKYKIVKEVIGMSSTMSLRIVEVKKASLVLNLVLRVRHGKVSIKGDALQLKFVPMSGKEVSSFADDPKDKIIYVP